jgi:uncharacterized protein YbaP (TraB family)
MALNINETAAKVKMMKQVRDWLRARDAEAITSAISKKSTNPATQIAVVMGMQDAVSDLTNITPGQLAHSIVMGQLDRIQRFGEKAYPLSEKQIAAIVRDLTA